MNKKLSIFIRLTLLLVMVTLGIFYYLIERNPSLYLYEITYKKLNASFWGIYIKKERKYRTFSTSFDEALTKTKDEHGKEDDFSSDLSLEIHSVLIKLNDINLDWLKKCGFKTAFKNNIHEYELKSEEGITPYFKLVINSSGRKCISLYYSIEISKDSSTLDSNKSPIIFYYKNKAFSFPLSEIEIKDIFGESYETRRITRHMP